MRRRASASAGTIRLGTERDRRATGTTRRGAGRSRRRPGAVSRARAGRRRRAADRAEASPTCPGLERFEGATFHSARWDHDDDLTRQARRRRSAPARRRSSSCPRSSPRSRSCTSSSARAPWVMPHPNRADPRLGAAPLPRASRPLQRLVRGGVYAGRELLVLGFVKHPRLMKLAERLARRHLREPGRRPGAAREGHARLHDRLQAHPALQRLVSGARASPTSSSSPTAIARGPRALDRHRRRRASARSTRSSSAPASTSPTCRSAALRPRPRRRAARRRSGTAARARTSARTVAGFPNLFILLGPNTGLGHSSMVYMIESQIALRDRRAARTCASAAPTIVEVRARGAGSATTPSSSARMRGHGLEHRLRELVPRRAPAATRRCGRTGRGASAAARARFDPAEHTLRAVAPAPAPAAAG